MDAQEKLARLREKLEESHWRHFRAAVPQYRCGLCQQLGLPSTWQIEGMPGVGLCTMCSNILRSIYPSVLNQQLIRINQV
jgi:hypothetical protein